jgi:hypothetical protein
MDGWTGAWIETSLGDFLAIRKHTNKQRKKTRKKMKIKNNGAKNLTCKKES